MLEPCGQGMVMQVKIVPYKSHRTIWWILNFAQLLIFCSQTALCKINMQAPSSTRYKCISHHMHMTNYSAIHGIYLSLQKNKKNWMNKKKIDVFRICFHFEFKIRKMKMREQKMAHMFVVFLHVFFLFFFYWYICSNKEGKNICLLVLFHRLRWKKEYYLKQLNKYT